LQIRAIGASGFFFCKKTHNKTSTLPIGYGDR
jgi:hypothetical protein